MRGAEFLTNSHAGVGRGGGFYRSCLAIFFLSRNLRELHGVFTEMFKGGKHNGTGGSFAMPPFTEEYGLSGVGLSVKLYVG